MLFVSNVGTKKKSLISISNTTFTFAPYASAILSLIVTFLKIFTPILDAEEHHIVELSFRFGTHGLSDSR